MTGRVDYEIILEKAIERASNGRNNAGYWLAQQLHANNYSFNESEYVMRKYVSVVGNTKKPEYTIREAMATLRNEYKRPPLEPWETNQTQTNHYKPIAKNRFATMPIAKPNKSTTSEDTTIDISEHIKSLLPIRDSPAEQYLLSRGISQKIIRKSLCAYSKSFGKIGESVVFALVNGNNERLAIHGRALHGNQKQTFGNKSESVFMTPHALSSDIVAIVEAPIDALSLATAGLPAIALCGTSNLPDWLTKELQNGINHRSRKVLVAFDNDEPGHLAANRILNSLYMVNAIRYVPTLKDWNDDLQSDAIALNRRLSLDFYVDSQEVVGKYECENCGAVVELHPYYDNDQWFWFECAECENTRAVEYPI